MEHHGGGVVDDAVAGVEDLPGEVGFLVGVKEVLREATTGVKRAAADRTGATEEGGRRGRAFGVAGAQPGDVAALTSAALGVADTERDDAKVRFGGETVPEVGAKAGGAVPAVVVQEQHDVTAGRLHAPVTATGDTEVLRQGEGLDALVVERGDAHAVAHGVHTIADEDDLHVHVFLFQRAAERTRQFLRAVAHGEDNDAEFHFNLREARMLTRCSRVWRTATTATAAIRTRVTTGVSVPSTASRAAAARISSDNSTAPMIRWKRSMDAACRARAIPVERGRNARSPPVGSADRPDLARATTTLSVSALISAAPSAATSPSSTQAPLCQPPCAAKPRPIRRETSDR